jgi:hypothetical protein
MRNITEWLASGGLAGSELLELDRRPSWVADGIRRRPPGTMRAGSGGFPASEYPGHDLVTAARVEDRAVFDKEGARGPRLRRLDRQVVG